VRKFGMHPFNERNVTLLQFLFILRGMNPRLIISKCSAFFLLLIFLQKNGGGLLIHNSRHTSNEKRELPGGENKKGNTANYGCSCLDEFLTPFTETELSVFSSPVIITTARTLTYKKDILSRTSVYSLLRGPPVSHA